MPKDKILNVEEVSLESDPAYRDATEKLAALEDGLKKARKDHESLTERRQKQMAAAGPSDLHFINGVDDLLENPDCDEPDLVDQLQGSRRKIQRHEAALEHQKGRVLLARDAASAKICEQFKDENLRLLREMLVSKIAFHRAVSAVADFRRNLESKGIQVGSLAQGNVPLNANQLRLDGQFRNGFLAWYLEREIITERERDDIMRNGNFQP